MWLPEDLEAVLLWGEHESTLCAGCGHPAHESMSPDMEGGYEVHAVACHACAVRESKATDFKDVQGVKLAVKPTPEAQAYLSTLREET